MPLWAVLLNAVSAPVARLNVAVTPFSTAERIIWIEFVCFDISLSIAYHLDMDTIFGIFQIAFLAALLWFGLATGTDPITYAAGGWLSFLIFGLIVGIDQDC